MIGPLVLGTVVLGTLRLLGTRATTRPVLCRDRAQPWKAKVKSQ